MAVTEPVDPIKGLTIGRRKGQRIYIGSRLVSVRIASIHNNKVVLYVEAPGDVVVAREEVLDEFFPLQGGDSAESPAT